MKKLINGKEMDVEEAILSNKALIHKVCLKHRSRGKKLGLEYDELYHTGVIGFIKAFNGFDSKKFKVKFATYIVPYVNGYIQTQLTRSNTGVKFPNDAKNFAYQFKKSYEGQVSVKVIQEQLNVTYYKAQSIFDFIMHNQTDSLNRTVFKDDVDEDLTLEQTLGIIPDYSFIHVEEYLNLLDDREKLIVEYMLDDKSQREIGEILGFTQPYVSRMIKKIQNKIKRNMELAAV